MRVLHAREMAGSFPASGSYQRFHGDGSVLRLEDVVILRRHSLICDRDLRVIPAANNEQILWHPRFFTTRMAEQELEEQVAQRLDLLQQEADRIERVAVADLSDLTGEVVYFMHPFEWYTYGHFFDTLQRLLPLEHEGMGLRTLLTCRRTESVVDFAAHLQVFGYHPHQILGFPIYCEAIRIRHLTVAESPSLCPVFTDQSMAWLRRSYLEHEAFLAYRERHQSLYPRGQYLLFLDRGGTGSRDIRNKQELLTELAKLGLPIRFFSGRESLLEMLLAFSQARLIIGAHGAMFKNTMFCDPEATIIELVPANRISRNMGRMCKPCLNHSLVILPAEEDHSLQLDVREIVAFTADAAQLDAEV